MTKGLPVSFMVIAVCLSTFFPSAAEATLEWIIYDDFSGGSIDGGRWTATTEGGGNVPSVVSGKAVLSSANVLGENESNLELHEALAAGIRADLVIDNFSNNDEMAILKLGIDFEGGMYAEAAIYYHSTSFAIDTGIFNPDHSPIYEYYSSVSGGGFGQIQSLGISCEDGSVGFWQNRSLIHSYSDALTAGLKINEIAIEMIGFNGGFSGSADNVSILIPEPASAALLGAGFLAALRRRRGQAQDQPGAAY